MVQIYVKKPNVLRILNTEMAHAIAKVVMNLIMTKLNVSKKVIVQLIPTIKMDIAIVMLVIQYHLLEQAVF